MKGEFAMDRKYFRFACAVAILFVAWSMMLPTAEARTLSGSRTTVTSSTDWFSAAVAWLADLLSFGQTGHQSNSTGLTHAAAAANGPTTKSGTGGTGDTGVCIDPMGTGICYNL
jgi:hypothetical protein